MERRVVSMARAKLNAAILPTQDGRLQGCVECTLLGRIYSVLGRWCETVALQSMSRCWRFVLHGGYLAPSQQRQGRMDRRTPPITPRPRISAGQRWTEPRMPCAKFKRGNPGDG